MTVLMMQPAGISLFEDDQTRAERLLLELADYIYGHTSLKPMSKTLFAISRCLLVAEEPHDFENIDEIARSYHRVRERLGEAAPEDDYSFDALLAECREHVGRIISTVVEVRRLTQGSDCLGLVFNALLRGKIEGGEGLGTYLTPEEVVGPMVQMCIEAVGEPSLTQLIAEGGLFGDICGGTGRFVFALSHELSRRGVSAHYVARSARLYDQSRLAVDLARINFILEGAKPQFSSVGDSLTDTVVGHESNRYALLATNPPFGAGKYVLKASALEWLSPSVLKEIASTGRGGAVDPAILFVVRNLDLLMNGGALAIVLPDGIARSGALRSLLQQYEKARHCGVDLCASVSLPSVTFALGGTVAKTSFVILRKVATPCLSAHFKAEARHVGFLKRGNRRVPDPEGNDLPSIAKAFRQFLSESEAAPSDWRPPSASNAVHDVLAGGAATVNSTVRSMAEVVRARAQQPNKDERAFHLSILDVDHTGFVDIIAAGQNDPLSRGIACRSGDVVVSCINPRHWRVTVVPELSGDWSCSSEFLVLRPRKGGLTASLNLALRLHHSRVRQAAREAATGTSSSRQRIPKHALLDVELPTIRTNDEQLLVRWRARMAFYEDRLSEAKAFDRLHEVGDEFLV